MASDESFPTRLQRVNFTDDRGDSDDTGLPEPTGVLSDHQVTVSKKRQHRTRLLLNAAGRLPWQRKENLLASYQEVY